ncbi:ETEC_3214 domain-containing protein [Erwinia piriflorinigrans]|uniref:Uncharacterized protein n=1 Tax=Erwinia piriflorinigrans CFBP 5888 TaxID=1161919 RepID=V5ZAX6_9GAMM|nr:ETEC_3214 domain-containing protein [Erwinia piriflorinigrans]CCG88104.1 hypothetical protein EPIR_2741 [Erwinia piriflorinigrans CFBP 5888]
MISNTKQVKKSLIAIIIGIITITISVVVTWLGALNSFFDLYNNITDKFSQRQAEDNLNALYTGSSIRYIESVFGVPIQENHSDDGKVNEYIYSFKKFYLQVIYDDKNKVMLYAVTSKDKNFHPKIPYLDATLGNVFDSYGKDIEYFQSGYSSKFYQYEEAHYLGNPGNYRHFYLAYNPAGVEYSNLNPLPDMHNDNNSPPRKNDLVNFRLHNTPNTFAVGDIMGLPNGPELYYGIGINYFVARDIPDKD